MKKVLVTGGAGFIGKNLIERLVNDGETVVCVDNYSSGFMTNHVKGVEYIDFDINEVNDYSAWGEFKCVYHLAALSRIQPSFTDPVETFESNVSGTIKVLEYARRNKVKVVYAGSSSKHHDPYQSPYAAFKYLGEELCKTYKATYNLDVNIARFYNVYGPGEIVDGDWGAVVGIFRRQVRDSLPLTIVGDGEQRRDFTHVKDIVDGLVRIANSKPHGIEAWELGSGINYSINELADMFIEKYNCTKKYIPDQAGNYRKTLRLDNQAVNLLGWQPKDRLKDYINGL
jgi:UDP-glucose 4-epimerase